MKAVKVFGITILAVQLASMLVFGLSLHTIIGLVSSAASGESISLEMTFDEDTGAGMLMLKAKPRNGGYLGVDFTMGLGALDEEGSYIARNSTSVHLDAGEEKDIQLCLFVPSEEIQEMMLEEVEAYLEVSMEIRTLNNMVGISNTFTVRGGG